MVQRRHKDPRTLGLRHEHGHVAVDELGEELSAHAAGGGEGLFLERNHSNGTESPVSLADRLHGGRSFSAHRGTERSVLDVAARVDNVLAAAQGSSHLEVAVRNVGGLSRLPRRFDEILVFFGCKEGYSIM